MEKTLVCILGQARAHRLTWDKFKKNLLEPLDADLALCVGRDDSAAENNGFYEAAKYIWEYEEPEDYSDAFDSVKNQLGSKEDWRLLLKVGDNWLGGIRGEGEQPGSAAILIFFRWFLAQKLKKNNLLNKYDRFILTRSDYMFCAPHPPLDMLSPDYIWMPEGEQYGGYSDRHHVMNSKDVIKAIDLMEEFIVSPKKLYSTMRFHDRWCMEKFIARHFLKHKLNKKVKIFPRVMFAVREKDTFTRWSQGIYSEELGFYIKYRNEFEMSYKDYCPRIKNNSDWAKVLSSYKAKPDRLSAYVLAADWFLVRFLK